MVRNQLPAQVIKRTTLIKIWEQGWIPPGLESRIPRQSSYYPNGKIILTQDVDRNDPTYFVCHLANRKREDATLSASIRATERRRAPGVVCCPVAPSKMPPPQKERLLYNQSFLSVVRLIIVYWPRPHFPDAFYVAYALWIAELWNFTKSPLSFRVSSSSSTF